jgi:flagella basal body P-ring formation protein FlgA
LDDDKAFSSSGDKPVNDSEVFTLANQLTRLVAQMSGLDEAKLKIEWRCGAPEFLDQAAEKERFKIKPQSTVTLGEVRFEVVDSQAGDEVEQRSQTMVRVRGMVQLICESVVATRALAPGEVITEKDVKLMTRRVSSYRDLGLTDIREVLGQEVARSITPDSVIKPALIRKLMLVKRNQKINVHSRVGSVQIDVQGTALESGAYGDVIRVRFDNQNRTIIHGHIAGPGMVMVTGAEPETPVKLVKAAEKPQQGDFPLIPREQK